MARWIAMPQTVAKIGLPHVTAGVWEAVCFAGKAIAVKMGKVFHTAFSKGNSFPRIVLGVPEEVLQFHRFTGLERIAGLGMERANTIPSVTFQLHQK